MNFDNIELCVLSNGDNTNIAIQNNNTKYEYVFGFYVIVVPINDNNSLLVIDNIPVLSGDFSKVKIEIFGNVNGDVMLHNGNILVESYITGNINIQNGELITTGHITGDVVCSDITSSTINGDVVSSTATIGMLNGEIIL